MPKPELKVDKQEQETIRSLYLAGVSQKQLANEYGVSRATIQNYIRGHQLPSRVVPEKRDVKLEWEIMARENHMKLSRRPDAVPSR